MSIAPKMAVSDAVRILKSNTGRMMFKKFPFTKQVYDGEMSLWSIGYFVSTVGVNEKTIQAYALTQEARCHNVRQLVAAQLFIHRYNAGVPDGEQDTDGQEVGSDKVGLCSADPETAVVTITSSVGNKSVYEFNAESGLLTLQTYDTEGQPSGDLQSFGDDALAEAALSQLHLALFGLNNPD